MNLLGCYLSGQAVDWGQFAIDVAFGAISGAFVGIKNPFVDGVISIANSVVNEAYSQYKNGFENFSVSASLQTVMTNAAADIIIGDIVSSKADDALSFVTIPRDVSAQSAADYAAKAAVREEVGKSASYYNARAARQNSISKTLDNWYCGLKSGISSVFSSAF